VRMSLAVHELGEAVGYLKTLRSLIFGKAFPTDPRKINNLVLTVDQEVGGSNPPSCTNHIAPPVPSLLFVRFVAARSRLPATKQAPACGRETFTLVRTQWNAADETSDACKKVVESSDDLGPTMIE
jgi:hypothetical protein